MRGVCENKVIKKRTPSFFFFATWKNYLAFYTEFDSRANYSSANADVTFVVWLCTQEILFIIFYLVAFRRYFFCFSSAPFFTIFVDSNEKVKHDNNFSCDLVEASLFYLVCYCTTKFAALFSFLVHLNKFTNKFGAEKCMKYERKITQQSFLFRNPIYVYCNLSSFMKLWNIHKLWTNCKFFHRRNFSKKKKKRWHLRQLM